MKLEVNLNRVIILKELSFPTILETKEGNQLSICMKDDTIEMSIVGSDKWYKTDIETGEINEI